jgi:MFS transporter, ACS family, tartrate transporter
MFSRLLTLRGDRISSESPLLMLSARRQIAIRLLPFLFILYLVNYIDRVNVSFAALRMSADLGFSDRVYGLGAGIFFVTYVLFEIPGAILVERWSARKWIARIMVTWGLVTILTAFIQTAQQFYIARLLLGAAEASFFPGVIVYLTRWFRVEDRARAIAVFYAAIPIGMLIGSFIASWILGIHWYGFPGWRWLFILEGIPAILLGIVTLFYLTDSPSQAGWLSAPERGWIVAEIEAERAAKKKHRDVSFWDACRDPRILLIVGGYFFFQLGTIANSFWLPTFLKRLSDLPPTAVARLVIFPAIGGLLGIVVNAWHSDKTGERKWHTVIPVLCAGFAFLLIVAANQHFALVVLLFTLGSSFYFASIPCIWSIPTMILSGTTAAAAFGLITSISQIGAFIGPSLVGYLNDRSHSILPGIALIGSSYLLAAFVFSLLRLATPRPSESCTSIGVGEAINRPVRDSGLSPIRK